MIVDQIKQQALRLFASKGYEATSLDMIATEVGRKKPSLYTHFAGKEQLFLAVFNEAIAEEIRVLEEFYDRHRGQPFDQTLLRLIETYKERYLRDDRLKLILYHGFIIPQVHKAKPRSPSSSGDAGYVPAKSRMVDKGETYPFLDLEETIKDALNRYFDRKEQLARQRLTEAASSLAVDVDAAVLAYSNLLEGMLVELIYAGPDRFDRRLAGSWEVFRRGILKKH
ncbi:TetR/AcrR family transcriptional regulator [Paenibacillus methanolicus]|uniref:Regulatory TetR family protein n=1 Tax=Paenibacillus methanolicus TaxID=582686 RepID=A0A5S5C7Y6_9BACL|nr:TetR/AcrR family transcriptional regulator [Paenibacillus methanolicus]TYP74506.1 regulatory TetR family protein [Paenibacillus methanolicus]